MSDLSTQRAFAVIDIGNSRIAVGRWQDSAVIDTVRVEADDRQGLPSADPYLNSAVNIRHSA